MAISVATFGAVGNGIADDTSAIQNAINAAQAARDLLVFEPNKTYRTTAPLIVQQGGASRREFFMDGFHSQMRPEHAGFFIDVQPQMPNSSIGTGQDTGSISMKNFSVYSPTAGASGIRVGRSGYRMYDEKRQNLLEDVTFFELKGVALHIISSGHFDLTRVVQRNHQAGGRGLILEGRDGVFCGDIDFNECQFGSVGGDGLNTTIIAIPSGTSARSEIRGVRFQNCVWYNWGARVIAQNQAIIADIWFDNCAWDAGPGGSAIRFKAENGGILNKVYIDKPYIVNYSRGIEMSRDVGGQVDSFQLRGGSIGMTSEPVWVERFESFSIKDMNFDGNTGWSCINVHTGSERFVIEGNQGYRNSMTNLIAVGISGSDRGLITNNVGFGMNAVQNVGVGPNTVINNNFSW